MCFELFKHENNRNRSVQFYQNYAYDKQVIKKLLFSRTLTFELHIIKYDYELDN